MKKRLIGWALLTVIWLVILEHIFNFQSLLRELATRGPTDIFWVPADHHLIWPLMDWLAQLCGLGHKDQELSFSAADFQQRRNLYVASVMICALVVSALIYILLIRKKMRDGKSTARKAFMSIDARKGETTL